VRKRSGLKVSDGVVPQSPAEIFGRQALGGLFDGAMDNTCAFAADGANLEWIFSKRYAPCIGVPPDSLRDDVISAGLGRVVAEGRRAGGGTGRPQSCAIDEAVYLRQRFAEIWTGSGGYGKARRCREGFFAIGWKYETKVISGQGILILLPGSLWMISANYAAGDKQS